MCNRPINSHCTEAEFLDVLRTKVLRVFLLAIHSTNGVYSITSPSLSKNGLKLVCNVNIAYGNLKSENSQDYAQQPQRNCTFMNSTSGVTRRPVLYPYTPCRVLWQYYSIFRPAYTSLHKKCRSKVQEATSVHIQHNSNSKISSGYPIKVRIEVLCCF